ncbi:MAG: hypothetical protein JJU18_00625 [Oceanicaulis sp.]|nr:hypothetical protein [Oceanicaulis sp.]
MMMVHIVSGAIALLAGMAALLLPKGSPPHRAAGHIFFPSMIVMAASGVYAAFLIPAALAAAAGGLTAYLAATGWLTVRRKENETGRIEWGAMLFALAAAAGCIASGVQVARGELTELAAGAPIPAATYFVYGGVALLSAALDLRVIRRGGLDGAQRIARHVWRMGFALYTAAASFFLGQPQVFPQMARDMPFLLTAPVVMIIALTAFWLIRVLLSAFGGGSVWWSKARRPVDAPESRR